MMLNATKPLAEQVAAGNLPSVVISLDDGNYDPVAVQSPIPPTSALYVWQCNQNMLSLVQLYSALFDITNRQNRGHPEPYNLSNPDDVYQIFAEQANNTLQTILEGPLSGFYVANRGETKQFTQQVTSAADLPALHTNFLSTIFKDFNLTANATNALDQLLSAFATAVGGFKLSAEARSKTIDYTLKINTVATIDLTEDPNNPILIYIPKTTLIYMRIKATAWQDAMAACAGTAGGAEQFEFDMTYEKTECQLDIYYYEQNIDRFDNILQFCTGQSLAAYGASLSQVVLNK